MKPEMPPSRVDIELPPLSPGIASQGPLPKGSRMSGLFESRSKPHVSFRNTLYESYMHVEHVGCQVGVTFGARVGGALRWGLFL